MLDVQGTRPPVAIHLSRVGVTNVKKLVEVNRGEKRPIILIAEFDAYVDLPYDQKGVHMSRNPEVINEVLEEATKDQIYEVESLCAEMAKRLLERHLYANKAEIRMNSELMIRRKPPISKSSTQEIVKLLAQAVACREGKDITIRKMVGAEVTGMTACPCAQEIIRENIKERLVKIGLKKNEIDSVLESIPMPTHNQRGVGTIMIEVPEGYDIRVETLFEIIEKSMSSSVYELLKREDEAKVVEIAHMNPMFVEDCVRMMIERIVNRFTDLPDDTQVTVRQINEESIHRHNALAERIASLGELRNEINDQKAFKTD